MSFEIDRRRLLGTGLAGGLVAAAPRRAFAQRRDNVLRAVMHTALRANDPVIVASWSTRNHGYNVYDTLFSEDSKFGVRPQMVETHEVSADKLTWTFVLRSGLKFHDGAPVTSADVIASLKRWGQRDAMGQLMMTYVAEWQAADERTVKLVLKKPYGNVLQTLAKPSSLVPFIMPARIAATPADQAIPEQVGSGPFRFLASEFRPGVRAVYERNPDYVPRREAPDSLAGGKVVKIDRYEWINMADFQTAVNALTTGEIDYFEVPPQDMLPILTGTSGVKVVDTTPLGFANFARMNWMSPLFAKKEIRQAVMHAMNQVDFVEAQVGNPEYFRTSAAMFMADTPFGSEVGWSTKPDVAKAKDLLRQGGYKGEPVALMHVTDAAPLTPLSTVMAQALKSIGMTVNLMSMDWQSTLSRRNRQEGGPQGWDLYVAATAAADLYNPISNQYVNAKGKAAYPGWPDDDEVERLRTAFAESDDLAKQKELATAMQARAYEVVTHVMAGQYRQPVAHRANVTGLVHAPAPVFWNVEKGRA